MSTVVSITAVNTSVTLETDPSQVAQKMFRLAPGLGVLQSKVDAFPSFIEDEPLEAGKGGPSELFQVDNEIFEEKKQLEVLVFKTEGVARRLFDVQMGETNQTFKDPVDAHIAPLFNMDGSSTAVIWTEAAPVVHQKKRKREESEGADIAFAPILLPGPAHTMPGLFSSSLKQKVSIVFPVPEAGLSTPVPEKLSKKPILAKQALDGGVPYILCNEQLQTETIQSLREKGISKGVHFGFSCWFNFDIMAVTKPSKALVCDINQRMLDFYKVFQSVLLSSSNRKEFIEKLQEPLKERSVYFDNGYLRNLPNELTREGSWLSSDEGFAFVKELHKSNMVEYRFLNATADAAIFDGIRSEFGGLIKTVYASNIYEWLEMGGCYDTDDFRTNMSRLLNSETQFIDAFYPNMLKNGQPLKTGSGPPLRISKGSRPSFTRTFQLKVKNVQVR